MGCASSKPIPPTEVPHVTMYGASWCPWCKKQVVELEQGRGRFTHSVRMCDRVPCSKKVDTVPTLVITKRGRASIHLVGFRTTAQLEAEMGV